MNNYNPYYYSGTPFNNMPYALGNQIQLPAPTMEIPKVNGEESARAFNIGPNSSVILMDNDKPLIWVVVTDASGFKTVTPFTITPYTPEQPVSAADLKGEMAGICDRLNRLEERMDDYAKSDTKSSYQGKSNDGNAKSNDRNGSGSK